MCGIAGYVGRGTKDELHRMIATLRHRGPDDVGLWEVQGAGFAHARLSIIDLSPLGHQPMRSADGTVTMVFNGEIYNYKELRDNLIKKGRIFKSQSDTEVIIQLYEEKGVAAFSELSGMFAIALYDVKTDSLFLARDRMGEKPLYYIEKDATLVFASEPKALFMHSSVPREIDLFGVQNYFTYDGVTSPLSIYKQIKKLEPASILLWKRGASSTQRYWVPEKHLTHTSFSEVQKHLDDVLRESVTSQLVSADVPVGVFLSGGVDSSLIAAYAQEASSRSVQTFSIGFTEHSYDESSHARMVANALGTEHHERLLTPNDIRGVLPRVVALLDEPIADPTILPNTLLAEFAREHVTVALGGDGADELFSGYQTFLAEKLAQFYCLIPESLRENIIEPLGNALPVSHSYFSLDFKIKQFLRGFSGPIERRHQHWIESWNDEEREALLSASVREGVSPNSYALMDKEILAMMFEDEHQRTKYRYLRTYLENVILAKVDRSSMMHSLEVRAPFLGSRVVDTALSLPKDFTVRGETGKYILRRLMGKKLPSEIMKRKKHGFALPVGEWLRGPWKELLQDTLSARHVKEIGICESSYVDRLVEEHLSGKQNHRKKLWSLLMFHLWYDAQILKSI